MTAQEFFSEDKIKAMKDLKAGERMIFNTFEDAKEAYYLTHQCESDNGDKEENDIQNWIVGEQHVVLEDQIGLTP